MSHQKDFYTAKEKLGLLSFGDPGSGDKVQVTDTYLVSLARKLDNKIKQYPEFKKKLVKVKNAGRKIKNKLQPTLSNPAPQATTPKNIGEAEIKAGIQTLAFTAHKQPAVSIIIPAFNKIDMTTSCLRSLMQLDQQAVPFQVIVIDNGSSDQTPLLKKVPGLTYVRNDDNLGFVGGCNSGIPHCKGEYVVFLNNDAEVEVHWLDELYQTITADSSVGLVGSKIIYPNGVLQEAGGIIFKDGSGLNYGKFDQSDAYQYNYVRDVDYCSGASIIISKKLLVKLGGFDTLYQPAYYEDTDLSFKVRQQDLRVVYQPKSVIYHIEGGTAGTNLNTGFKRFQEINRKKFLVRWSTTLKDVHISADDYYLGRDRSGDKLALIIEEALPTPDKDSGSVRMMAIIKSLQTLGYKITFWPNNLKDIHPYTENLQAMGVEVVYGRVDFMQFAKHYAHYYDLVIMSRPEICARYINICKSLFTHAKLVYDTVDLHYLRLARQAEIETANAEALLEQSKWYKVLEMGLMERTDATFVVSDKEVEILKGEDIQANVVVVSNIHSVKESAYASDFSARKDIIFVGNYAHLPNRDSVLWFMDDIFPLIRKSIPSVNLHIVGANMPNEITKKVTGKKNVIVDGYVSDNELAGLLTRSRVFVAPLRYGAGVKGKIGQSIEYGLPIVTTSIGAEGMHLKDSVSCLQADDAETFAQAVIKLYDDQKLWEKVQRNARVSLERNFSIDNATSVLKELLVNN